MSIAESRPADPVEPGDVRVGRALLSVSDKRGLVDFARGLVELGVEIVASGGTRRELGEAGIETRSVDDYTGFPEILDGRVKTLNPKIHAGLLAVRSNPDHVRTLEEQGIEPIDLVCVNLYPFEQTAARLDVPDCRGHREHRRGRSHDDQGRGQEPRVRGGRGRARELRRGARRAPRLRWLTLGAHAPGAGGRCVRADGALRRGDRALVRGAGRRRLPAAHHRRLGEGAGSPVRREPAPARGLLLAGGCAIEPALAGLAAAWQGPVLQQPPGSGLCATADGGVQRAGRCDREAQQPVRRGRGQARSARPSSARSTPTG